jgi:trehalose 6-phosphate phosphatase
MAGSATPQATAFAASLAAIARTDRLLIALDFDGTVSAIVDRPEAARVLPEAVGAIAKLEALPRTWVAYVSGRPLDSLARVTQADPDALLIGSHGVEVRLDGGTVELSLNDDERHRLAELDVALTTLVDANPGAMLEHKPAGLGVHTRLMDQDRVPALHAAARSAANQIGGFLERGGKDILEFAVRDATKGDGVDLLRSRVGATAVLYAGDDVTDEDAFARMRNGDIGVKVGDGETAAGFRVADPKAVAVMLGLLAGARANAVGR